MTENDIVSVILSSGLVEDSTLTEMQRWGLIERSTEDKLPSEELVNVSLTREALNQRIEAALNDSGYVVVRETDMDVLRYFIQTIRMGSITLIQENNTFKIDELITIQMGLHPNGDIIIPWDKEDDLSEIMTNGQTYVTFDGKNYYFREVKQVFYGKNKAFILCTPSTILEAIDTLEVVE